ncbi:ABC transporter ATP-binding protein [Cutibacterium sp.]|uniref:ABC transporter ATP-binding protein n=1 Tax=Cutibacterium sp. TaxID=1912221 RepID=UPI0026DB2A9F|nr:ABC transporter ATP-binding protein [Cutibacterium sp.]MDO4412623.1 ABC transporter ATP-binding protein [Cutibacterium sp.]
MIGLALNNLSVGYISGRHVTTILSGVTGTVKAGQMVGLVGPNGAGKSTLLRSVAGLQPALEGEVSLNGTPTSTMSRRQIAQTLSTVLTDRVSVARLTSRDVVSLGRHPHSGIGGRLRPHDQAVIDESLTAVGAAELADSFVGELSDGQRQRVMVARALAQEPSILLLDEPTSFLDPPGRIALLGLLREVCTTRKIAVVVCSHDIEAVMRYTDTLWVAGRGTDVKIGAPEDLARSGALEEAFRTDGITFDLRTLTFWQCDNGRPTARILGSGTDADLARHTLTRSGYRVVEDDEDAGVTVSVTDDGWSVNNRVIPTLSELHDHLVGQQEASQP